MSAAVFEPFVETAPLGRRGLRVPRLGFGTAPLGDLYEVLDDATAIDALAAAVEHGMTLIDTSPLYGHGLAEQRVGTLLRRVTRDALMLSTKVGRVLHPARGRPLDREGYKGGLPFNAVIDYSYDGALRSLEQSMLRLGTDRLDIVLIHDLDRRNHGDALDERLYEALNGAYVALAELRDQGVVRAIGIGVNEAEVCTRVAEACDIDCVLLAGRYSLLDQASLDTFLPLAQERNIGILLGGVFNSGILARGAGPGATYDYAPASPDMLARVRDLEVVCMLHGVPLASVALQFPRAHPAITSVVVGGVSRTEVHRNAVNARTPIPAQLWDELKSSALVRADAPVPGGAC